MFIVRKTARLAAIIFFLSVQAAAANCTNPGGKAGDLFYNTEYRVMQWCDGARWIAFPRPPFSCMLDGQRVRHGQAHIFYSEAVHEDCVSAGQERSCDNGELDGDEAYEFASCTIAASCTLDGETVPHGQSHTFYTASAHEDCAGIGQERTCDDGTLDGDAAYEYASCAAPAWVEVSGGDTHTCGVLTDGTAWCWGSGDNGRRGDGSTSNVQSTPVRVGSDGTGTLWSDWISVSAGWQHSCGVRADGTAWCWGSGTDGRRGDGSTTTIGTWPVQVGTDGTGTLWSDWISVSAGNRHSCGVRADGTAWCWGYGHSGRRGDGSTSSEQTTPVRVGTADTGTLWSDWTGISAGNQHTCGMRTDGTAWCWGSGANGRRGDGSTSSEQTTPVQVGTDGTGTLWSNWISISTGSDRHSCGVRADGTAWCWGSGANGRRGDGSTSVSQTTPVQVGTDGTGTLWSNWISVSAGSEHSCGARDDGTTWCWGSGGNGRRGDGSIGWTSTPVQVGTDGTGTLWSDWISVSAGSEHSCGARDNGTAWCWGHGGNGRRGDGSTSSEQTTPVAVQ